MQKVLKITVEDALRDQKLLILYLRVCRMEAHVDHQSPALQRTDLQLSLDQVFYTAEVSQS